jgi:hypothetical protein
VSSIPSLSPWIWLTAVPSWPHPLPVHLSIGITVANHSHVHQSGVMSQAWSSTACSRWQSTARDVIEPRPLAVVAARTVPIGVDLEAPIDDVTGLPLIMCPDCKDVRVFAANTTYTNNVGKRFFKCPRKNRRNVSEVVE